MAFESALYPFASYLLLVLFAAFFMVRLVIFNLSVQLRFLRKLDLSEADILTIHNSTKCDLIYILIEGTYFGLILLFSDQSRNFFIPNHFELLLGNASFSS